MYLTPLLVSQIIQCRMVWLVNNELKIIWNGAVVAKLRYSLGIILEGLRKTTEKLSGQQSTSRIQV
jgi:hypothetical protein